ncbi:hypothetical protein [Bordetella petrii]|uniref:hypothetical protein n=1 Tax=Bordetella petrii TaxID=94624 RepID=UPI00372D8BFE
MTAHHRPPHDEQDDLDLRALYRTLPDAEPGPELDAAVRATAARAAAADRRVQRQRRLWHPGWGVAASIVLASSLFLLTDFQDPEVAGLADAPPVDRELASPPRTLERPAAPPAAAPTRPEAPAALRRAAPAAPQADQAAPAEPGARAPRYSARPQPEAAPPAGPAAESDPRIERVRELLRAGEREQALAALRALQREAPGLALPPDLRALLPRQ